MTVPTEPGWYCWTPPSTMCGSRTVEHDWKPMWVANSAADPLVAVGTLHSLSGYLQASKIGGEFGPRIPSAERLRAMEEVIADIASNGYAPKLGMMPPFLCAFCRTPEPDHAPDCPWLRAQKEDG